MKTEYGIVGPVVSVGSTSILKMRTAAFCSTLHKLGVTLSFLANVAPKLDTV